jgi:hypothetical protein
MSTIAKSKRRRFLLMTIILSICRLIVAKKIKWFPEYFKPVMIMFMILDTAMTAYESCNQFLITPQKICSELWAVLYFIGGCKFRFTIVCLYLIIPL